ncbi:hypothetical protein DH2020_020245 [Rehmannia glutinosa]|uniref:Tf2-1-like SH3-like domain-containing protein n=1 Tax=Rehmannia glutinosa TaxID=99300 RepID=A0ABR0WFK0_REHGL
MTFSMEQLAQLYIEEIVRLHRVPVSIVSDRATRITSNFWMGLQRAMGTRLKFSTAFHPQKDVSPMKGIFKFGKRGKLNPRYVGPYEVLEQVGRVAYRLALPPAMSGIHNVFHVSMLRRYMPDPSHVVNYETISLDRQLSYEEKPVAVLDRKVHKLRNRDVELIKVKWSGHSQEEAT